MRMLGIIELVLLAALTFLVLASALVSLVARPFARRIESWAPTARHRAILAILLCPALISGTATVAALLPSLRALCLGTGDHCAVDADHLHLCLLHHPAPIGYSALVVLGCAALWSSWRLARAIARHTQAARLVRSLLAVSRFDGNRRAWLAPMSEPLCLSAGLWSVEIIVSAGLLAHTSDAELEIMLRHERAHQRRRDALLGLIARATSVVVYPTQRRALISQLELAAEQACDEESAIEIDDRLRVAELLLKLEHQLARFAAKPLVVSIGSSSVPARVEALLSEPRLGGGNARVNVVALGVAVAIFAGYEQVHHLAERLLAGFGR